MGYVQVEKPVLHKPTRQSEIDNIVLYRAVRWY